MKQQTLFWGGQMEVKIHIECPHCGEEIETETEIDLDPSFYYP